MYSAALLHAIEDAGTGVLTLTEGLQDDELLASRLTRAEVTRQLRILIEAASALPQDMRDAMPEVDWPGILATGPTLVGPAGAALNDAMLFGVSSLVPATLMWLRVYRQQNPQWFKMALNPTQDPIN